MPYLVIGLRSRGDQVVLCSFPGQKRAEKYAQRFRRFLNGYQKIVVEKENDEHRAQGEKPAVKKPVKTRLSCPRNLGFPCRTCGGGQRHAKGCKRARQL